MLVEAIIFSLSLMFTVFYLIPNIVSWAFRFNENILLRKMKREFKKGLAKGSYYPYGKACCTRCDFKFSGGEFSTTLDPASAHPFANWETISWNVNDTDNINTHWVGKKMHSWLQRKLG